jgi:PAS domain S-box-containing protein
MNERPDFRRLRQRALEILKADQEEAAEGGQAAHDELERILHEMRVQQIELELQNEELRNAQTRLARSEQRYISLYHRAPVGYLALARQGFVMEVNQTFADMVGYEREQITGKPFHVFVNREDQDAHYFEHRHRMQREGTRRYELRLKKANGTLLPVRIETSLPDRGPNAPPIQVVQEHYLVTVSDITEEKIRQATELQLALEQERSELLRRFVGDISHDLKTPLQSIMNMVYLLHSATDPATRDDYADRLQSRIRHLTEMVNDMIAVSELDELGELHLRPAELNPLVEEVGGEMGELLARREQQLELALAEELPKVALHEEYFRRALANLIRNASNFTSAGGRVVVRTRYQPPDIRLEVQDFGKGIAPDELNEVFQRYYRGTTARDDQESSIGLGLAIVKAVIDAHGGRVTVDSTLGEGSTFSLSLPAAWVEKGDAATVT